MAENEAERIVSTVNDLPQTLSLTLDQIIVDDGFNVRQSYGDRTPDGEVLDEKAATALLADSIERDGLRNPVFVRRLANGKYFLLAGFRRMRALALIEKRRKSAGVKQPVSVRAEVKGIDNEEDAHFLNVRENTERKSLTPYEIARKAAFMSEKFDLRPKKIGEGMGVGEKYVANLIRIIDKADPRILAEWSAEHPQATLNYFLQRGFLAMDHDEQWHKWQLDAGLIKDEDADDGDDTDDDDDDDKDDKDKKKSPKEVKARASAAALRSALKAVKDADGPAGWTEGATAALLFALGKRKTLGDVYNPTATKANAKANAMRAKKAKAKAESGAEA